MRFAEFEVRESLEGDWLRLVLLGELDLAVAPELEARLEKLQAAGRSVLVDLSELEFMDSSGLAIIMRAISSASSDGWTFAIDPDLSPQVHGLFRLTGVDQFAGRDCSDAASA